MGVLEELKRMQTSGMSENQIVSALRERGVPYKDISDAFSQTKIKAAVNSPAEEYDVPTPFPENQDQSPFPGFENQNPSPDFNVPSPSSQDQMQEYTPQAPPQMQEYSAQSPEQYPSAPSPDSSQQFPSFDNSYSPYPEQYPQDQGSQYPSEDYQGYDYQSGMSADTISEIAEQILAEKMSDLRKKFENAVDFKNTAEAKMNSIEERLKRIEKVVDTLQTSVLRKVGDYITNVDDIKKELIETQKSFTKLLPELKEKTHSHAHSHSKAHSHSAHKTHKTTHKKKSHK